MAIHADAPIEAPTVRGFVAILVEGLDGATVEEVLSVRDDLIERIGLPEILGMLRVRGPQRRPRPAQEGSDQGRDGAASGPADGPTGPDGRPAASRPPTLSPTDDHRDAGIRESRRPRRDAARAARSWSTSTAGRSPCSTSTARFYAIDDVCTHDGGPLAEGELEGAEIRCPRHGARFDVRTGKALCFPAFEPVDTHAVEVRGDDIYVALDD